MTCVTVQLKDVYIFKLDCDRGSEALKIAIYYVFWTDLNAILIAFLSPKPIDPHVAALQALELVICCHLGLFH